MSHDSTHAAIRAAARAAGICIRDLGEGFLEIRSSSIRVAHWPELQLCYVSHHRDPWRRGDLAEAVRLAATPPEATGRRRKRHRGSPRGARAVVLEREACAAGHRCHWCRRHLEADEVTLDHLIPVGRGGLDEAENLVPCCADCNQARADDMPELEGLRPALDGFLRARRAKTLRDLTRREVIDQVEQHRRETLQRATSSYVRHVRSLAEIVSVGALASCVDPRELAGLHARPLAGPFPEDPASVRVSTSPGTRDPEPSQPPRPLPSPRPSVQPKPAA